MLLRKTTVSILSILISSCSIGPGSSKTEMGNQLGSYFSLLSVETYEGCHELESSIQAQLQERADNDFERALYHVKHSPKDHPYHDIDIYDVLAPQQDSMAGGAAAGAEPEQFTNIQEEGIDEPDFIKVGSHFIFVAKRQELIVTDRKSLDVVKEISLDGLTNLVMYAPTDRLVLVGTKGKQTIVKYYDASKGADLELLHENAFASTYVDSRLTNNRLVLVLKSQLELKKDYQTRIDVKVQLNTDKNLTSRTNQRSTPESSDNPQYKTITRMKIAANPLVIDDDTVSGIACNKIVKQAAKDGDMNLIKLAALDLDDYEKEPALSATLGAADQVYMSQNAIYVAKEGLSWMPWTIPKDSFPEDNFVSTRQANETMVIYKGAISANGTPSFVAVGSVQGKAKDQYSFKDYTKHEALAVATTTFDPILNESEEISQDLIGASASIGAGRNHLWVLRQEGTTLEIANSINNYGKPGEDIRSVRFLDDYAYVVTFKKTDPLFAFNLADPFNPTLEGELEIPGFSMYLHPAAGNKLVGVGFDATEHGNFALFQGIQVSLFDVSNSKEMSLLDSHVHGKRGSYSDVTGNPHAFYFDQETQVFALPVVELGGQSGFGISNVSFSGAVVYQIEGERLEEAGRLSHSDMIPENCLASMGQSQWWSHTSQSLDINRIFSVDGYILAISRFGISRFEKGGFSDPVKSTSFASKACH